MNSELKILFVEDLPTDVELAMRSLNKEGIKFQSRVVETEDNFLYELNAFTPDIIISDFQMPQFSGMDALKLRLQKCPITPFILLTGSLNEEVAVECMKIGATDYIIKEHITRLPLAVKEAIHKRDAILEKEITEKRLVESELKQRLILDNINEIIYSTEQIFPDSQKAITTFVSSRSEAIIGIKSEDFLKNPDLWNSLIHPDDISRVHEQTTKIFISKKTGLRDYRIFNKQTNKYIWVEDLIVPKLDDEEKIIATIGVARDITERRQAEEELKQKNTFIQTVMDNLPIGIALNEIDKGNAFYMNQKFEEIYGWPKEEMKDIQLFFEKVYPDEEYRNQLISKVISDIQSGDTSRMHWEDCVVTHKDGSKHIINAVNIPLHEQNTMVSTVLDMTERKKAENELIEAKERAEEMNRLKSIFLSNMSHELRTPLNGIMGYSELLTALLHEEELLEMARGIYSTGKRLGDTVNFILDLTEVESNKIEVLAKEVEVAPVIKEIVNEQLKIPIKKDVVIETDISDELIIANLDERLFKRIVNNLLSNALKYTNKGKVIIRLGKEFIDGKEWFILAIEDTGIGIAPDKLDIIWEEFRQASEGFSRLYEGTGLGLTIAKKATEIMNGKISVESKLGVGSVFTIRFPMLLYYQQSAESAKDISIPSSPVNGIIENDNLPLVLFVEDDLVNRRIVKRFLHNVCNLEMAADGKSGLKLASEKKYELILLDINLGDGMDGMELVKEILKMEGYVKTPVVAITAYAMGNDRLEFLKGGFTHYLAKPFSKNELLNLVNSIIGKQ